MKLLFDLPDFYNTASAHEIYDQAKEQRHHDSGENARDEQISDGCLGDNPVNDEDRTRGDQNPQGASGGNGTGTQTGTVFVFLHFGKSDCSHGGCGSNARTGAGGKSGAG